VWLEAAASDGFDRNHVYGLPMTSAQEPRVAALFQL